MEYYYFQKNCQHILWCIVHSAQSLFKTKIGQQLQCSSHSITEMKAAVKVHQLGHFFSVIFKLQFGSLNKKHYIGFRKMNKSVIYFILHVSVNLYNSWACNLAYLFNHILENNSLMEQNKISLLCVQEMLTQQKLYLFTLVTRYIASWVLRDLSGSWHQKAFLSNREICSSYFTRWDIFGSLGDT